jgi:hypothetical protein
MSEARVDRLEADIRDIKGILARLEPMIIRIDATLPSLANKAELADLRTELLTTLADKPSRGYLWGVMGMMVASYTAALAAAALLASIILPRLPPAPIPPLAPSGPHANAASIVLAGEAFDWDRYHDRQDACREADRIVAPGPVRRARPAPSPAGC